MVKKCTPGFICIETATVGLIFIIIIILFFLAFQYFSKYSIFSSKNHLSNNTTNERIVIVNPTMRQDLPGIISPIMSPPISTKADPFNDPYYPPLKNDLFYMSRDSSDIRGFPPVAVPVNIHTRGYPAGYTQLGILTRTNGNDNLILPLMGRRVQAGSNSKYQYYTISNNGNINTKLPIKVKGKNCINDYGCDEIYTNDVVYVEGYKDTFTTTVYENNSLAYI